MNVAHWEDRIGGRREHQGDGDDDQGDVALAALADRSIGRVDAPPDHAEGNRHERRSGRVEEEEERPRREAPAPAGGVDALDPPGRRDVDRARQDGECVESWETAPPQPRGRVAEQLEDEVETERTERHPSDRGDPEEPGDPGGLIERVPDDLEKGPAGSAAEDRGQQAMAAVHRVASQDRASHDRGSDAGEKGNQDVRVQCAGSSGSLPDLLQVRVARSTERGSRLKAVSGGRPPGAGGGVGGPQLPLPVLGRIRRGRHRRVSFGSCSRRRDSAASRFLVA